ncbi:hypothetical protein E6Q11_02710 [Candidatus Dojkabacteria bacterium]|uniref:Virulence-associated protein E-like domain-containing protein n=1 Tax=Candidatus Dojkabacteria bacterium TaxID=2099670 RepID=A0A5C7J8I3_9BACT|nr:MAG: hypothetical protein E6Q11_02710 [Candidatus Dojkabacteria bacterium]
MNRNAPTIDNPVTGRKSKSLVPILPKQNQPPAEAGQEPKQPPTLLDVLLSEMSQIATPQEAKVWLVENATRCAKLTHKGEVKEREQITDKARKLGVDYAFLVGSWANLLAVQVKQENPKSGYYRHLLCERLGYSFALNECTQEVFINGKPATDGDVARIRVRMRDEGVDGASQPYEDLCLSEAYDNTFHPVKSYLESLTWDGKDHIAALAGYIKDAHSPIVYADGTSRTVVHAALNRWLIGAVARVYQVAQNFMLVLAGKQDDGKSSLVHWLGSPLPEMRIEEMVDPNDKEHHRYLAGKWVWEAAEFGNTLRKTDREALKSFITKAESTFRVPFAKHSVKARALANFIGTVNSEGGGELTDPTGNRRFFIIDVTKLDWDYSKNIDVNQVWAQALHLYKSGVGWTLTGEEKEQRDANNQEHTVMDSTEEAMRYYFEIDPKREDWVMYSPEITDVLRNKAGLKDSDKALLTSMGIAAKKLGVIKKTQPNRFVGIWPKGKPDPATAVALKDL